jgi:hypothetical protein
MNKKKEAPNGASFNDFYGLPLTVFKRNRIKDGSSKEFSVKVGWTFSS